MSDKGRSRRRDLRLDLFRGMAMAIIFIAHVPWNHWDHFIPARFGPSDATELFVFISGFASAYAFGSVFARRGFGLGLVRLGYRIWQVFWAHNLLFISVFALMALAESLRAQGIIAVGFDKDYLDALNFYPFIADPARGIVDLLSLRYVPNYFDILPMYLVVLAMMPVVVGLHRLHPLLALAFCLSVWLLAQSGALWLPAEWWSDRPWYFNPFGWQLIFYSGFALASGWVRPPPPDRRLVWACLAGVAVMIPLAPWPTIGLGELGADLRATFAWGIEKSNFGLLRWLHFLMLAYLAYALTLAVPGLAERPLFRPVVTIGQQSLAAFLISMFLAQVGGIALDILGRDDLSYAAVNLLGILTLYGLCCLVAYVKAAPWIERRGPLPAAHPGAAAAPMPQRTDPKPSAQDRTDSTGGAVYSR